MAGMTEEVRAISDDGTSIPAELPDPPVESDDRVTVREAYRARELLEELARRASEALNLFEPLPVQREFFDSLANERIFLGGNRGGKTITAAVEVARIMTGQDPHRKQPKRDGNAILVGKNLDHCGKVMVKKLFKPGAFWIIKDPETKLWRAYRESDKWDRENKDKRRPAPPLIPPRLIKSISWENKKEGIIKSFYLKNGWEGTFYSSEGDPPQGVFANLVWFDEEIVGPDWYLECSMRLVDRDGIFIWSATPQAGTIELYELYDRALAEQEEQTGDIAAFQISMMDNPHLDDKAREKVLKKIKDEGDYEVRVDGKFAIHGIKIYPEFESNGIHSIPPQPIPSNWTRYVSVDPGVQVCGVLFLAVPPPGTPGFSPRQKVIYDELYIKRCDAKLFGRSMVPKCQGIDIHDWVVDKRMGRQTTATGKTYARHYEEALEENKLKSERSGSRLRYASDDVDGGIEACRQWIRGDRDGTPHILVMTAHCPNFVKEIKRYVYIKRPNGEITDKPSPRKFHLMDCFRYLAKLEPRYRKSENKRRFGAGSAMAILESKRERAKLKQQAEGGSYVSLG